ncbi:MAG: nodulation protein NodH [Paracoccaceae bacterium]|nr:nodulation protein NodH [Paracoccaceae bacterium]
MGRRFDSFVIFAEMRTGSNLLEAYLDAVPGITCYGEVFNPSFIGQARHEELFGVTMEQREADPLGLVRRIVENTDGLPGFRFFHDHDPRVLDQCLADRRCAKLILTRNPLESYVSLKIAAETGQWRLKNVKNQRSARIAFDGAEFQRHLDARQGFQVQLLHAMQVTGQTAFYIDYEDLQDLAVINGIFAFLGLDDRLEALPDQLKKQNPEPIADKVTNPDEMAAALARLDRFDLSRTPNFEPRRGAAIPGLVAAAKAPVLYMPIRSGIEARVEGWLEGLGQGVQRDFTRKDLRQWRQTRPCHRSFTVLVHPLPRAHAAFCQNILTGRFGAIRNSLRRHYQVDLPDDPGDPTYDPAAHRAAFLAFLRFLKSNLNGQTSLRVDPSWASQTAVLEGYSQIAGPDFVFREDRLEAGLAFLAAEVGQVSPPMATPQETGPHRLADIHDAELEAAIRDAYPRDYANFGFGDWTA